MSRLNKILTTVFLAVAVSVSAQEFKVESFNVVPEDLTARTNPKIDNVGKKCALIKVYVDDKIAQVRGNIVGDIQITGMEKSFYVSDGTRQIELVFENHYPLRIVFDDYYFPALTGAMTYLLKLSSGNGSRKINTGTKPTTNNEDNDSLKKDLSEAYDAEDYNLCYQLAIRNSDNQIAQFYLGRLYRWGDGVTQDYNEALKWYLKAAEAGNSDAMFNIGALYDYGRGVSQDYNEALKWYLKAAEADNSKAMLNIGILYDFGNGVTQDYNEALKWYLKAADTGNSDAMFNIGLLYRAGDGVPKNYNEALKWWLKAADGGDLDAMVNIGNLYLDGLGVTKNKQKAIEWYQKAADLGNLLAKNKLEELK